ENTAELDAAGVAELEERVRRRGGVARGALHHRQPARAVEDDGRRREPVDEVAEAARRVRPPHGAPPVRVLLDQAPEPGAAGGASDPRGGAPPRDPGAPPGTRPVAPGGAGQVPAGRRGRPSLGRGQAPRPGRRLWIRVGADRARALAGELLRGRRSRVPTGVGHPRDFSAGGICREGYNESVDVYSAFAARYPFPVDHFQEHAIRAIEAGQSVIVSAPTGAGKTLVAEFAIHLARDTGRRIAS